MKWWCLNCKKFCEIFFCSYESVDIWFWRIQISSDSYFLNFSLVRLSLPRTALLRLSLTTPHWFLAETYQSILMMIRRCASDILEERSWRRWLSMFQQTSLSWKFGLHAVNIVLMILIVTQLKISLFSFIGRENFEIWILQYDWHMLIGWLLCWRLYLPHHILVELWALLRWALT